MKENLFRERKTVRRLIQINKERKKEDLSKERKKNLCNESTLMQRKKENYSKKKKESCSQNKAKRNVRDYESYSMLLNLKIFIDDQKCVHVLGSETKDVQ